MNNVKAYYLLLLFSFVENFFFPAVKPALIPHHSCIQNTQDIQNICYAST